MNWKEQHINIGKVKEKTKIIFNFFTDKSLDPASFSPGCPSCTKILTFDGIKLQVEFTSDSLPKHLNLGEQKVTKYITVIYKDNTFDKLSFTGTIIK